MDNTVDTALLQQEAKTKQERNTAFEWLRIIAMLFIIAHHFAVHGAFDFSAIDSPSLLVNVNHAWTTAIAELGRIGVSIFVLISAYFLSGSTRFRSRKLITICFEVLFFSIVFGSLSLALGQEKVSFSFIRNILFPIGSGLWWFMTSYVVLYVASPFLNLALSKMNRKSHLGLVIICLIFWSLLPTFVGVTYGFTSVGGFIALYFGASYIRKYKSFEKLKPWVGILLALGVYVLSMGGYFLSGYLGQRWAIMKSVQSVVFDLQALTNFFQIAISFLLFVAFKNMKLKTNKAVNFVAASTFTIYLVHDSSFMRRYLWLELFRVTDYAASPWLIPFSIGVILAVFAGGFVVFALYRFTFKMLFELLINKMQSTFLYKIDNVFSLEQPKSDTLIEH